MQTFILRFREDGLGEAKRIEFDADGPRDALEIARRELAGRAIELWDDRRRLAVLRRNERDVWQVV